MKTWVERGLNPDSNMRTRYDEARSRLLEANPPHLWASTVEAVLDDLAEQDGPLPDGAAILDRILEAENIA